MLKKPLTTLRSLVASLLVLKMESNLGLCLNPDLDAERRFVATLFAQIVGGGFLLLTGIIFFFGWLLGTSRQPQLPVGIGFIFGVAIIALFIGVVGAIKGYWPVRNSKKFEDENIDKMLALYLGFDIPLITILVCQQGGLTKSVLFAFFFLIPVAHRVVERPDNERWILRSHLAIALCMLLTFIVSLVWVTNDKICVFGAHCIPITDLTTMRKSYALAVLVISFISLGTPILMEFIKCTWPKKLEGQPDTTTLEKTTPEKVLGVGG